MVKPIIKVKGRTMDDAGILQKVIVSLFEKTDKPNILIEGKNIDFKINYKEIEEVTSDLARIKTEWSGKRMAIGLFALGPLGALFFGKANRRKGKDIVGIRLKKRAYLVEVPKRAERIAHIISIRL